MEQNLGPVSQIGYHPGILVDRIVVFDQLLVCKPFYFTGFLVIYSAIKYNNIYKSDRSGPEPGFEVRGTPVLCRGSLGRL